MQIRHAPGQNFQAFFPLASPDQFTDSRHQKVHGCHGLIIIIESHIKGLDILGIISDKNRFAEYFLGQVPLVFGLEVATPGYRKVKFLT
jgi:hypothetical protein